MSAESANMIIMLYAHARTSGDGTLLAQYVCRVARSLIDGAETRLQYNLTKRWADYLVDNALAPGSQCVFFFTSLDRNRSYVHCRTSGDGQISVNMTNLAIKGIIAVKAMAEVSRTVNQSSEAQLYDVTSFKAIVTDFRSLNMFVGSRLHTFRGMAVPRDIVGPISPTRRVRQ